MNEILLNQEEQLWAQLQLLQSQVVDQILLGETSKDWVGADLWLKEKLEELEPAQCVVFTSSEDSRESVWAQYQSMLARFPN